MYTYGKFLGKFMDDEIQSHDKETINFLII